MKKILVFMLVAMSVSMANIDLIDIMDSVACTTTDRSSFKLIKTIPGPAEVLLSCRSHRALAGYVTRYEVAFDRKLTYIVVAIDYLPGARTIAHYVLTMHNGVYRHYYDNGEDGDHYLECLCSVTSHCTVKEKVTRGKSSRKEIRRAYEKIMSHFTINLNIGETI